MLIKSSRHLKGMSVRVMQRAAEGAPQEASGSKVTDAYVENKTNQGVAPPHHVSHVKT